MKKITTLLFLLLFFFVMETHAQKRVYVGNCRGNDNVYRDFRILIEGKKGSRKVATMGSSNKWNYCSILIDDGKGYFKVKSSNGVSFELRASANSCTRYKSNGQVECVYTIEGF